MLVVARLILLDLAHNAPVVNNVPAGVRHDGMVCIFCAVVCVRSSRLILRSSGRAAMPGRGALVAGEGNRAALMQAALKTYGLCVAAPVALASIVSQPASVSSRHVILLMIWGCLPAAVILSAAQIPQQCRLDLYRPAKQHLACLAAHGFGMQAVHENLSPDMRTCGCADYVWWIQKGW